MNKAQRSHALGWAAIFVGNSFCYLLGVWPLGPLQTTPVVWLASGFALATVLLVGRGAISAIVASTFCGNLVLYLLVRHLPLGEALFPALLIAVAKGLEPWIAAWWTMRFCHGRKAFRRGSDFFRFVLGVLLIHWLGALIAAAWFYYDAMVPIGLAAEVAVTWWGAAVTGVLLVTPLMVIWSPPDWRRFRGWEAGEAGILLLVLGLCTCLADRLILTFLSEQGFPRPTLIILVLLWVAFRFRGRGATVALGLFSVIAIPATLHGFPIFRGATPMASMFFLQLYIGILTILSLGFVAILEEGDEHVVQLHRINQDLEAKVATRTRQLERINQELTDAVSIVAHDVRGPVSGIRTLARHMRWAGLDLSAAEGNELLGEIERTSAEAVEMMGRLLDLQRASHRVVGLVKADVGNLVADMCRHYEIAAKEKGVALEVTRPGREMAHLVDADGLKFIVSNLVSNALKFLPQGGVVKVRLSEGFSGCTLVVADNGPGIAEQELAGIFRRFAKAANRPTAGETSTGLGLFIVRKLVLAMGGTLYVESEQNDGATFIVDWPAEAIRSAANPGGIPSRSPVPSAKDSAASG